MSEKVPAKRTQKPSRAAIADRFTQAKKFLWDGKPGGERANAHYVCWAIDRASGFGKPELRIAGACKAIITERLGGLSSLADWLRHHHYEDWALAHRKLKSADLYLKLQVTRHAWLDSLIEEFSN